MKNLGGTVILLLVAIVLLWLAVTDKLGRLLDAWSVVQGKASATGSGVTAASNTRTATSAAPATAMLPSLPSLPALGSMPLVGA